MSEDSQFTKSDSFFIGVRVKKNTALVQCKLDLTDNVKTYYEFLYKSFLNPHAEKVSEFSEKLAAKQVDF